MSCPLKKRVRALVWQLKVRGAQRGQATVEYLIVGLAIIMIVTALGALSGRLGEGLFVQHAADSASHAFTANTAGSVGDVLLY